MFRRDVSTQRRLVSALLFACLWQLGLSGVVKAESRCLHLANKAALKAAKSPPTLVVRAGFAIEGDGGSAAYIRASAIFYHLPAKGADIAPFLKRHDLE